MLALPYRADSLVVDVLGMFLGFFAAKQFHIYLSAVSLIGFL